MPIKVLAYGDAGSNTGFEKVLRNVMTYLQKTGDFEIVVGGVGYRGGIEPRYPYPVFCADSGGDPFGFDMLPKMIERVNPDVLWFVQDLWNITNYMSQKPSDVPAIVYFPVDTPNMKWSYALSLGAVQEACVYTNFGAVEAAAGVRDVVDLVVESGDKQGLARDEKRTFLTLPHPQGGKLTVRLDKLSKFQNPNAFNVVPHGVDLTGFKPMSRTMVRSNFGIDQEAFVVGGINTNQFRKRQDLLIRMFAALVDKVPQAKLLLYCTDNNFHGWDLQQCARYYGISDHIYLLHEHLDRELTDQELAMLYNACDVHVNTGGGEGWGLTSVESAACGVAQMVPDWSATREIWGDDAYLIPVLDYRMEPKFINTCHALVDVKAGADWLIRLATEPELLADYKERALACAARQPTWDDIGATFAKLIYRAVNAKKIADSRSFNDLLSARKGVVESELARVPYLVDGKPIKLPR